MTIERRPCDNLQDTDGTRRRLNMSLMAAPAGSLFWRWCEWRVVSSKRPRAIFKENRQNAALEYRANTRAKSSSESSAISQARLTENLYRQVAKVPRGTYHQLQ